MHRFCMLWLVMSLALVLFAGQVFAQTSGKLEGIVRDKDTGDPIAGVQVTVVGTRLGNVTNKDGYYFILNVPVGNRTVKFVFTGYKPVEVVDARVPAGNTITVNAELTSTVIGMEAIVIEGESDPLVARDNVQTRQNLRAQDIQNMAETQISDMMNLQAGVVVDYSGNFSLRGGREGEEAMYVDGVLVKAQNEQQGTEDRGAVETSAGGVINPLVVSNDAMEEVNLITGGFQAEFGNAQSGLINIVTKQGGTQMAGNLKFITDQANPRGMDYGYNNLEGSLGGPIYGDKLNFFVAGMIRGQADATPRLSGDKGGFRGVTQSFINSLNRDLGNVGVVTDGVADRDDAINPLTVNSFAEYRTTTKAPDLGYGVVNEDGTYTRGFSRTDGLPFRLLTQSMVIANPADVATDGTLRSGAQPLIQIDPTTGRLWTLDADGKATTSPDAIAAAFASGVAVANPLYSGPYMNSNPARLPGNWKDLYTTSFKSTYAPTDWMKFITVYHRSRDQRQYYDHAYMFNNPYRTNQAQRLTTDMGMAGMDWTFFRNSNRSVNSQLRLSYFKNDLDGGLLLEDYVGRNTFMGVGGNIGFYDEDEMNRYSLYSAVSSDGYANDAIEPDATHSDIDRTHHWPTDQVTASNIFGATTPSRKGERGDRMYPRQFVNNGMSLPLRNDTEKRWGLKFDMDSQLDRYNRVKVGFENLWWNATEVTRFYYGEFTDDQYVAKPRLLGVYAQDRMDFGDLVIDLGVRMDRYNVNKAFPIIVGQNNPDFSDPTAVPEAKTHFSPRIGVAHPITDRTQVRLSYGHFYQVAPFELMYAMSERDFATDALSNPNQNFGNGWLDMAQTIQFEAGFTTLLSEDMVLDFVGYNREIRGNFGLRLATADDLRRLALVAPDYVIRGQGNMEVVANQDNGNVRGFDLTMDKRYSRYFGVRATYSLMFARSTQSDPQEYVRTLARQLDPFTNQSPPPPSDPAPTDDDRTHQLNVMLNLLFPDDFQKGTHLGSVLRNAGAYFDVTYNSGAPYTPVDEQGNFITAANSARMPGYVSADLRLNKSFAMGNRRLNLYVTIMNLFENVNYGQQAVDPTSGQVGVDKYFLEELLPSAQATAVTTEAQLIRDLNKDGYVTKSEAAAASYAKGRAQDMDPLFWLNPREVRLGVEYSF
ncbi:TonB-dependent receptor [bacterium]|nr:TonB-dependent receptor [bacterium]